MSELSTAEAILAFLFALGLSEHLSKVPRHFSYPTHLLWQRRSWCRLCLSIISFGIGPLIVFWILLVTAPDLSFGWDLRTLGLWIAAWTAAILFPGGFYRFYAAALFREQHKGDRLRNLTFQQEWEPGGWCYEKMALRPPGSPLSHALGGAIYWVVALVSNILVRL